MCNLTQSFFFCLFFWVTSGWLFKNYIIGGIGLVSSRRWRLPNYRNRIIINSLNFDLLDDMWLILIVSITPRWCVIDPHPKLQTATKRSSFCALLLLSTFNPKNMSFRRCSSAGWNMGLWHCVYLSPQRSKRRISAPLEKSWHKDYFFSFSFYFEI